jgi:ABC-2 type transport system permease protein
VFATLLPLILIINAIGLGAAAIGGSESDGTLELLLANPVSRARLFAGRALGALLLASIPALTAGLAIVGMGAPAGLLDDVSLLDLAGATLASLTLALLFGALALAVGAATGSRGLAVSVSGGAAVAGYLLQGVLAAADAPAAVRNLVPWHWYLEQNMLVEGVSVAALVLPIVVGGIVVALGAAQFVRRDLT